jgi:hypothetical protein
MKRALKALVLRTHGSRAFPLVLANIDNMSEAEAEQWYRLLSNIKESARQDGAQDGARHPWRRF